VVRAAAGLPHAKSNRTGTLSGSPIPPGCLKGRVWSTLRPDAGQIWIAGENIAELEDEQLSHVRRKMGFLFQSAALFDSLTLHDNLALPFRRLTNKSTPEIEGAVDRALSQVGLASDKNKMPVELQPLSSTTERKKAEDGHFKDHSCLLQQPIQRCL
jgi:ABC-type transporter Mla maintaining outer membrane lipid asymmetry ATPase subunit MlaF